MSAERKKLIWITALASVFVLGICATGFFLFRPVVRGGESAPAAVNNLAAPKAEDPQDYLQTPPIAPGFEQPRGSESGIIVVYGDKPASLSPQIPSSSPASASSGIAKTQPKAAPAGTAQAAAQGTAKQPAKVAPPAQAAPKKTKVAEYWVQAASFTSRGRADELKDLLAAKGIASLIMVKEISGKSWYRVRVGPYAGKSEAEGWLGRIKAVPDCSEAAIWTNTVEKTL
jgi:cell division protein FtsN